MKRIISVFLVLTSLFVLVSPVLAYDAEEHDEYLEKVLFGNPDYSKAHTDVKDKIQMLEYASYLAIDQCNGKGQEKLDFLKSHRVKKLPKLSEIDLDGIFYGSHRNYTHRGWDYKYQDDKANWPERQKLLKSTVNKIFNFGAWNERRDYKSKTCESFSALIYYVHILGDIIEEDNYKKNDLTISFAKNNVSDSNPDVFWELKKHCEVVFENNTDSMTYKSLIQKMDVLAGKARSIAGSDGGVTTNEKFEEYHGYAEELMDLLCNYVPLLLKKEVFFKEVF